MEGDAGRDANKSLWCWAGMVTLRRSEKPENKVRFFEHQLYIMPSWWNLVDTLDLGSSMK